MKMNLNLLAVMLVITTSSTVFACGGNGGYSPAGYRPASVQTHGYLTIQPGVTVQHFSTGHLGVGAFQGVETKATASVRVSAPATVATSPARVSAPTIVTPGPSTQTPPPAPVTSPVSADNRPSAEAQSPTTNSRLETFFSGLSTEELLKFSGLSELR